MTSKKTRQAAKVMVDSLKKGAVVEWRPGRLFQWHEAIDPNWNWFDCNYRIAKKKRRKAK